MKENTNKNSKKYVYIAIAIVALIAIGILLYIVFKKEKYSVTFLVDNNVYEKMDKIVEGDTISLKTPEKEGYTFDGWYVNDEKFDSNTKVKENLVLEARFTINSYTVTFEMDNGSENILKKVKYNETVEKPKTPTKKGYNFIGWYVGDHTYSFDDKITKDITISAKWSKNTMANYTVETYLMDLDGEYGDAYKTKTYKGKIGSTITPEPESYKGFTTPEEKSKEIKEDGSTTIRYYYERNQYQVSVVGDQGIAETIGSGIYYYGSKITIRASLKDGYAFNNWSNKNDKIEFTYKVENEDVELKATTNLIHYSISYVGIYNGIEDTIKTNNPKTYTVEDEVIFEDLNVEGYTFKNYTWNDKVIEKIAKGTTGNLQIKANFDVNTYTVTFETELGQFTKEEERTLEVNYKELVPNVLQNDNYEVTRVGYKHIGWSLDKEEEKQNRFDFSKTSMPAHDITLYPMWEIIPYKITYQLEQGVVCSTCSKYNTYTIESNFALPVPEKEGYHFEGWMVSEKEEQVGDIQNDSIINQVKSGNIGTMTLTPTWRKIIDVSYIDEILNKNTDFMNKVDGNEVLVGYKEDAVVDSALKNTITANLNALLEDENIREVTINGTVITKDMNIEMQDFTSHDTITVEIQLNEEIAVSEEITNSLNYTITFRALQKMTQQDMQTLIDTNAGYINSHKGNRYEVLVENDNDLIFKYANPKMSVFSTMDGAGLKTAMQEFLGDQEKVGYIIITFAGMGSVPVTYDDIKGFNFWGFGLSLLDSFEAAVGKGAFELVNEDLLNLHATLEIVPPDGKYYDSSFTSVYNISFAPQVPQEGE